jgi:cobalt-zinc-cadmium efflux system outer membrane protein
MNNSSRLIVQHLACAGLCTLLTLPTAKAAGDDPGASEASLIEYAEANSAELAAARLDYQASQARAEASGRLPDPEVEIELRDIPRERFSLLPQDAGSTRYLFRQALPFPGKRALDRSIAAADVSRSGSLRDGAGRALRQRIRENYARYWYAIRADGVLQELERDLSAVESLAQSRYRAGVAAQQDLLRAAIERNEVSRQRLPLTAQRQQAIAMLNTALGRPPEATLAAPQQPPGDSALPDLATLQRRLSDSHPALVAEQSSVEAARLTAQRVRRDRYPDFTLGVAPIQMGRSLDAWDVMLGFTLPLQRSRRHAEERAAGFAEKAAAARRDALQTALGGALADNWARHQAALRETGQLRDALLPLADANYRSALANYAQPGSDLATVLDALRQKYRLQLDLLAAHLELRLRALEIEALAGEPS